MKILVLLLAALTAQLASSFERPDLEPASARRPAPERSAPARSTPGGARGALRVVLGLPETIEPTVRETLETLLAGDARPHEIVALDALPPEGERRDAAGRTVALGAAACERLADGTRPLLCALISAEAFSAIPCDEGCAELRAIVMDQPLERQVAVAGSVYPSLERFGVLSADPRPSRDDGDRAPFSLDFRRFEPVLPLPDQLNAVLAGSDALVAQPESAIFNRSTLHVVLLTAYGYAKPVIGFNRAYVRAGALISAYSTPAQVLAEVLEPGTDDEIASLFGTSRTRAPARFSIAENPSIARSLGLVRRVEVDPARSYSDEDFSS